MNCIKCGSSQVQLLRRQEVIDFRGLTLEVDDIQSSYCTSCGKIWQSEEQAKSNALLIKAEYQVARDEVRQTEGLLTGDQIATVLDNLKITKAEAARLFGGGPNAFAKYINGEVLQSFAMDRLLRLALAFGDSAVDVLRMGGKAPMLLGHAHLKAKSSFSVHGSGEVIFVEVKTPQASIIGNSFVVSDSASPSASIEDDLFPGMMPGHMRWYIESNEARV